MNDRYGHTVDNLAKLGDVIARTNLRKLAHNEGMRLPHRFALYITFDARLLRWIDANTTGCFYRGSGSIMFAKSEDAMMFKIGVKNDPR